jgi:hypothetical protein
LARILGDGKRQRTCAFEELVRHYLFQERFGQPGKRNDKGKVGAQVNYSQAISSRHCRMPLPSRRSTPPWEEHCHARQAERADRHEQTIGERLVVNQTVLRVLPETPFEPCGKRPGKVSSIALVRYYTNDHAGIVIQKNGVWCDLRRFDRKGSKRKSGQADQDGTLDAQRKYEASTWRHGRKRQK